MLKTAFLQETSYQNCVLVCKNAQAFYRQTEGFMISEKQLFTDILKNDRSKNILNFSGKHLRLSSI